jgi:hypothetical protein
MKLEAVFIHPKDGVVRVTMEGIGDIVQAMFIEICTRLKQVGCNEVTS